MADSHWALRMRLHFFAWTTMLAVLLTLHFMLSCAIWAANLAPSLTRSNWPRTFAEELRETFLYFAPAVLLLVISAMALVLSLQRGQKAWHLVLIVLVASVAFFALDVYFARWQIHIFIARQEYWDNGGAEHLYYTWWWYNDRWFC